MKTALSSLHGISIGRTLMLVLVGQGLVATLLLLTDFGSRWHRNLTLEQSAPSRPVSPGDQVRRYAPDWDQPRFADQEDLPGVELPEKLPEHLDFVSYNDPKLGEVLLLNGVIAPGDSSRVEAYLTDAKSPPAVIALNSPGGTVEEAIEIGRALRDRNLAAAILPGMVCVSSCPYVFAGGTERTVSRRGALGLHQHYYDTPGYMPVFLAVKDIQHNQGRTMTFLIEMGIDPGVMVHSLNTPPDEIYILVDEELTESYFATHLVD